MTDKFKGSRIIKAVLAFSVLFIILKLSCCMSCEVYADAEISEPDWDYAVGIDFIVTDTSNFVTTGDEDNKQVMVLEDMKIPYFDLANYDLQSVYYNPDCYKTAGQTAGTREGAYGKVTLLHVFIYMTEVYKCGVSPQEAGKGYLKDHDWPYFSILKPDVGSVFINFWSFGPDIVYYVNYEYPLGRVGWGATLDQILISDGDVVHARHDNGQGDESVTGTFYHFGIDPVVHKNVYQGNSTPVTLCKTGKTADYSGTSHKQAGEGHTITISKELGGEALVTGTTNSYGDCRLDTSQLPLGKYYVTSDTFDPAVMFLNIVEWKDPADTEKEAAKAEAEALIEEVKAMDLSEYTESSAAAIESAIKTIEQVLADQNVTAEEIKTAKAALDKAVAEAEKAESSDQQSDPSGGGEEKPEDQGGSQNQDKHEDSQGQDGSGQSDESRDSTVPADNQSSDGKTPSGVPDSVTPAADDNKKDETSPDGAASGDSGNEKQEAKEEIDISTGTAVTVKGSRYVVTGKKTVALTKAKNVKSFGVPKTVTLADGKAYKVTQINAKAFTGKKIKTVTLSGNISKIKAEAFRSSKVNKLIIKTKLLKKASVKGSLKGSKVKIVKVKVGKRKENKSVIKKYRKFFTKKNAGKAVKVF